jgi:predicted nucleic acid-binding Zn ribbon protein
MSQNDRKTGPVRLDRILDGVLSECGLSDRMAERSLLEVWPQIVGERIARHVRAVDLRDGVLLLAADHGAWRQEVTLLLPRIREQCNERFGEGVVQEIRWARPWQRTRHVDDADENSQR